MKCCRMIADYWLSIVAFIATIVFYLMARSINDWGAIIVFAMAILSFFVFLLSVAFTSLKRYFGWKIPWWGNILIPGGLILLGIWSLILFIKII